MSLYRGFFTVGGLTAVSRVFGFVRDILLAAVMGTGWVADAFFVSWRFPNLFRALFAEGAFNSAFVPLYAKELRGDGAGRAYAFSEEAMAILLFFLTATVVVGEIFMPYLVQAMASGFMVNPQKFALAVFLTRITFPYLICMSLVALIAGVLNAHSKFSAPAATPIIMNLVLIVVTGFAALIGVFDQPEAGIIQAIGVTLAGVAQLVFVAVALHRLGLAPRPRFPRLTPGTRRLLVLMVPGLVTGGINQLNLFVGTTIASLQDSAVSYLYYADRINQLPLGMVAIAIGVVLLPDLTKKLANNEQQAAMDSQNRSLEFALLLTVPAAVALFVIARPIVLVLFQHGSFTASSTVQVSEALAAFAVGLPAYVMTKVFLPGYFAREDTSTPMWFAMVAVAVNICGSLALFWTLRHVGIAVATSLSGWANALLLALTLVKRGHFRVDATLMRRGPLILLSSVAMGVALALAQKLLSGYFGSSYGNVIHLLALSVLIGFGGLVYVGMLFLTGAMRVSMVKRAFAR